MDDSSLNYRPFLKGVLNKVELNYNQMNSFEISYEILLSSYNYICSIWEPILENTIVKLKNNFVLDKKSQNNLINMIIEINEINMNMSDMAISSMFNIFQSWSGKFIEDEKKYSKIKVVNNNKIDVTNDESEQVSSKMTNTSVINCTGMNLKLKYIQKEYKLTPDKKIDLEYIINWNYTKLGAKQISISIDDNTQIKKEFKIFFEKLEREECQLEKNYFLIAEKTLTKDRHINISIYSPIIFKNKTQDIFQIQLMNSGIVDKFDLLRPNKRIGIGYPYCNGNTLFSINLFDKKKEQSGIKFHLKDIIENDEFSQALFLGGKVFWIKLIKKLNNLKEILITFQYSIINGLPCELFLENPKENKRIKIKKFTQYFVDFYSDMNTELVFEIKIGGEYYYSAKTQFFKINPKQKDINNYFTDFFTKDKSKSFRIKIKYDKTSNTELLIFYSESFLYNCSGVDFEINSQDKENPLLFNLNKNLYLISSKFDYIKNGWIQLKTNRFLSEKILFDEIIKANPYYELKLINNRNILNLSIRKEMSYIPVRNNPHFKEKLMIVIYKIYPFCKIVNLLQSNHLLIAEEKKKNNQIIINSLNEISFNFFEKGKNTPLLIALINTKDNKSSPFIQFKLSSLGIFTFCIENTLINIEIKESNISGVSIEIFVVESNIENAKIVVENKTDYTFIITQDRYEQFKQILSQKEKQILRIYGQDSKDFLIKDSKMNQSYKFSFNSFKDEDYKNEINDLIFIKESNGMKMKLTIIKKENINQMTNTILNIGLKFQIRKIFLSVIGDNEYKDKKLRNYKRYELLLISLNVIVIDFNMKLYSGLLDNEKYNLVLFLQNMTIYNQISKYGKYSTVFKNISLPMFKIETEIIDFKNSSMSRINKFGLNMGQLKLSIDPSFIKEIINFRENLFYRMEITDFNVDEVFLHKDRNYQIKKQFENYQKENSIYSGTNFSFPVIDVNFELNEVGLEELLKEKLNIPQFLVWIVNGLVGTEHNIHLKTDKLKSYFGSLKNLLEKIILMYKDETSSEIYKIGFKGFLGQIGQLFNFSEKTKSNCTDVQKGRIRNPRVFFGEYKYFKKYDENEAKNYKLLDDKFNLQKNLIYLSDLISGKKFLFTFTKSYLLILDKNSLKNYTNVNYDWIDKAECDNNCIIIYMNEKGKKETKRNDITLDCENELNAKNISKLLNEKSKNY